MLELFKTFMDKELFATVVASLTGFAAIISFFNDKNDSHSAKKKKTKKIACTIGILVEFLALLLGIAVFIIAKDYTIMPEIKNLHSETVIEKLGDCGLEYDLNNLLNNDNAIVYSYSPAAGTLVKRNTVVDVVMLDSDNPLFFTSTISEQQYNSDYSKTHQTAFTTFNTNALDLYLNDVGVRLNTKNYEFSRTLGQLNISNALVQLVNYDTNEVVQEKISNESGEVHFQEIPSGVYIYRIVSDNYDTRITHTPFGLAYNPNSEEDILAWSINLLNDEKNFIKQPFQVKIVNESGRALKNKEFEISAFKNENGRSSYNAIPAYTDKNGILSLWHAEESNGITTDYYDEITFELATDYSLDIQDSTGHYATIDGSENKKMYELQF